MMSKVIIGSLNLVLTAMLINGCSKITNINNDPKYSNLINSQYISIVETMLYKPKGKKEYKIGVPGEYLPKISEINKIPYDYDNVSVYKIIPTGTIFEIVNISKEYRPMSGTYIKIEAKMKGIGDFENTIVDIIFLSDFINDHKKMDSEYLIKIHSAGEGNNE